MGSTPQTAGRHTEVLSEGSAEMGLIIEPPGVGDLADRARSGSVLYQFAIALLQTLHPDPTHQGHLLVREQAMNLPRGQTHGVGDEVDTQLGITEIAPSECLDPVLVMKGSLNTVRVDRNGTTDQGTHQIHNGVGKALAAGIPQRAAPAFQRKHGITEHRRHAACAVDGHEQSGPPQRKTAGNLLFRDADQDRFEPPVCSSIKGRVPRTKQRSPADKRTERSPCSMDEVPRNCRNAVTWAGCAPPSLIKESGRPAASTISIRPMLRALKARRASASTCPGRRGSLRQAFSRALAKPEPPAELGS
jgi:hypothetical protein